jgi:hypothetical protein
MSLSDPVVMAIVALSVVVLLLIGVVTVLGLRMRRLSTDQRRALDGVEVDVIATLARVRRRLDEIDATVTSDRARSDEIAEAVRRTLGRIGVVRYDAYAEIGGAQSFSAALLDDHGDGVVITSITGRNDGRTYLKSIAGGEGSQPLSDEETAAVAAARAEARSEQLAELGKRSWRQR